jgi:ubiquinone/menaquinone biosynthesis C-methylase UbiE
VSDQATEESRQVWDSVASGWDKERALFNEIEGPVTERMHEALGVRAGDSILELCAGPGEVGLRLAERYPGVKVLITDFAPGMVQAATREAHRRGLSAVECRLMDAQDMDLPDASVDGVLCRYGLMLVPDVPKAFSEVRRVLRPGGVLAYTTWTSLETNPVMMIFGGAMIQCGHFQPPDEGLGFPLASEEENRAVAEAAGFDHVQAEAIDLPIHYASFERYWGLMAEIAGPLAVIMKTLPEDDREAVRTQVEEYAAPFRTGDGLTFPSRRLFIRAS